MNVKRKELKKTFWKLMCHDTTPKIEVSAFADGKLSRNYEHAKLIVKIYERVGFKMSLTKFLNY